MSAPSTTTPPPPSTSELQVTLPPAVIQDASPASSPEEGSKKRARSEVAIDETATVDGGGDGKGPAKKKAKMTEAEMEERRKAKEAKEKEKEVKEKERAAREEERATKEKKKKDEEKKKKDDEKKKKDEEKAKKDRAQTRLQNFFVKPSGPPSSPAKAAAAPPGTCPKTMPPELEIRQKQSDYEKSFQPFFVKPNVTVAPFQRDDAYKFAMKASIDKALAFPREHNCAEDQMETVPAVGKVTKEQITELLHIPPHKRGPRGKMLGYTTKDLLARINAPDDSSLPPIIELKKQKIPEGADGTAIYFKMLNCLPNKFLKFAEDVRPPYSGTFTRNPTTIGLRKGRNPFQKTLPNVNYDYDSEVEWEEGAQDEDGEELLSDDGEEDEEVESLDDEMDGFLDDEEDQAAKNRRGALAALVPLSSGLCWEDEDGRNTRAEFEEMKMEVLLGEFILATTMLSF
ncbi:chromatin assembly factor 1 subunit A-domain-containing protein [Morchella snyderi]|nr:chromatin assembly factor 1 subunit A-domain-containing protein [Morchella snyderi]